MYFGYMTWTRLSSFLSNKTSTMQSFLYFIFIIAQIATAALIKSNRFETVLVLPSDPFFNTAVSVPAANNGVTACAVAAVDQDPPPVGHVLGFQKDLNGVCRVGAVEEASLDIVGGTEVIHVMSPSVDDGSTRLLNRGTYIFQGKLNVSQVVASKYSKQFHPSKKSIL